MPFIVTIDRRSFLLGSLIALALAGVMTSMRSGCSVATTHIPGLVCAWGVFAWMYFRRCDLPSAGNVLPIYFTAMSMHLVVFAEQFVSGFPKEYARLYGGPACSDDLFVATTMVSAALFTLTSLAVYLRSATFLLVPVLFFAISAVYGNAFVETWWSFEVQGYFPGLFASLPNWLLGPLLIAILVRNFRATAVVMIALAVSTGLMLTLLRTDPAERPVGRIAFYSPPVGGAPDSAR